ncbi:hypothetical protein [Lewinella sp. 4G2]|uniref:hypothetical protein n=1 Tax=Lewinella sp. 4G2 TaxID=1803372 RepID=UPI0007B479CB|nr:hypothetical protein [Lewinella sp. 4G2]OAV43963.1 hypothetical protein A3850_005405 [Lewinella sp. 4G2]
MPSTKKVTTMNLSPPQNIANAIRSLETYLRNPKNLNSLYSQASRQVKTKACQKRKISQTSATRAVVHDSYEALRRKLLNGKVEDLSEENITSLLRSIIALRAKQYGKPGSNHRKVSQASDEFNVDFHDPPQVSTENHLEEDCSEAFLYLKKYLKLNKVDEFLLREMLAGVKYNKSQLAKTLDITPQQVQGKRDYLRRRINDLNKVEPLRKRLAKQHI